MDFLIAVIIALLPVVFLVIFIAIAVSVVRKSLFGKIMGAVVQAKIAQEAAKPESERTFNFSLKLSDLSLWSLIGSNLFALWAVVAQAIPFKTVMLIYWFQSVIIGLFVCLRMLLLKDFSTEGMTSNGQPVPANQKGKKTVATFFFVHYGFFHFIYAMFILGGTSFAQGLEMVRGVAPIISVFFLNHLLSFFYNFNELTAKQHIGNLMLAPYGRILPMHIIIIFGSLLGQAAIVPFLLMKTALDAISHMFTHKAKPAATA